MPPNQLEIQRQLMKKYNIIFDRPIDSITNPQWPSNCNIIFDHIQRLGKTVYSEYHESISADFTRFPWRQKVQQRAKRVTDIAKRCLDGRKNESGWRLTMEPEVMARFSVEVACQNCRGRLWRSEIEATQPGDENDNNSLRARQEKRKPCKCNPGTLSRDIAEQGISPLFDDRAEEAIIYSRELRAELRKREHRPDRVYGLRVTERFSRLLDYARDIRTTPFRPDGEPLAFPFLVIEAKSEKGSDSFTDAEAQTSFAIRELLSIQQELAHAANEDQQWYGGPLVWFLSYRGEQWRVFAAYIHNTTEKTFYRAVRLWSGSVDSLDGALQLLLIIDYIADWARDIYREGIALSLLKLAPNNPESLRLDPDVASLAGNMASWFASNVDNSHNARDKLIRDPLYELGNLTITFRDARFVRSRCIGSIIAPHNVEAFLRTVGNKYMTRDIVIPLLQTFKRSSPCLVKGQALIDLELLWTDTERGHSEIMNPEDAFYVVASATFYLDSVWQPTRELNYLAVSQKLIQDSVHASFPSNLSIEFLDKAPRIETLEAFRGLLHMSIEDNLKACFYEICLQTDTPDVSRSHGLDYVWKHLPKAASDDANETPKNRVLRACERSSAWIFVRKLYSTYKVGGNEPNISFIRISSSMDRLASMEDLRQRPDLLDQSNWPWKDHRGLLAMRDSNKQLIVAMGEIPYQRIGKSAHKCVFVLDPSLAQRGIPRTLFSDPPETYITIPDFDENRGKDDDWASLFFRYDQNKRLTEFPFQISDDIQYLKRLLDVSRKWLRRKSRSGSFAKWKQITTGWAKDKDVEPFDFSCNRPFTRQSYQVSLSSSLLKTEDGLGELANEEVWSAKNPPVLDIPDYIDVIL
ncbi:hypothetical protein FMEXI_333 [Fusarium mexicanum]|uniref:Uncharacterized protein n=1 Tax=Fusarium mexicanum TaxID=751941 RepID=A0A8H5JNL1_9HYPO|nr:hypothetical protein FMEXI_333 [Fusarium mexicanum]